MRFVLTGTFVVVLVAGGWSAIGAGQSPPGSQASSVVGQSDGAASEPAAIVETYCAGCHNGVMRSPSGALLDRFDTSAIAENPDVWSRAYRQLQAGTMPPVGAPRPTPAGYDALMASIETALGSTTTPVVSSNREIAERLALLLWNSNPDELLAQDVRANRLTDSATLERHVRRMLQDDRARAFVTRFFVPWLGLSRLSEAEPEPTRFPEYSPALRDAMVMETELFVLSQLREDRDPIELWNANYTYLNEHLARHYGIGNVAGERFHRVELQGRERAGLLGQGSIHMLTSPHRPANQGHTSPAARAIWVRMHFLGAPAPRPFPNAAPVKPDLPITPQTRALPAEPCANCHRNFFPLGYALENFDAIGRWRTRDSGGPVDASGAFVDGSPTDGVVQLRDVLLQRPNAFRTTITERLLIHAAGLPVSAAPASDSLIRARQVLHTIDSPRWSSLVAAIVRTTPLPAN